MQQTLNLSLEWAWHCQIVSLYKLYIHQLPCYLGKLIANYLDNRSLRAQYNGTLSQPARMHAGVPQGSVLGPIDVVETKDAAERAFFADDIATWTCSYGLSHIETDIQPSRRRPKSFLPQACRSDCKPMHPLHQHDQAHPRPGLRRLDQVHHPVLQGFHQSHHRLPAVCNYRHE